MSANSTGQSGTKSFAWVVLLSCLFAMLLGFGGGFGTAVGFGAVGLVMPVLAPALLTAVLLTGEPWGLVDNHFLPRAALASIGMATVLASLALLWRDRRQKQ